MKIINTPKLSEELEILPFQIDEKKEEVIYYEDGVQAGFPSPADDFKELRLSLDSKYLKKPNSTYLVKVKGSSMFPTLNENDILVVRSDFTLEDNDVAIISVNHTDYTVKRFNKKKKLLVADNPDFDNIKIKDDDTLICLGVVKHLIRDL